MLSTLESDLCVHIISTGPSFEAIGYLTIDSTCHLHSSPLVSRRAILNEDPSQPRHNYIAVRANIRTVVVPPTCSHPLRN